MNKQKELNRTWSSTTNFFLKSADLINSKLKKKIKHTPNKSRSIGEEQENLESNKISCNKHQKGN